MVRASPSHRIRDRVDDAYLMVSSRKEIVNTNHIRDGSVSRLPWR